MVSAKRANVLPPALVKAISDATEVVVVLEQADGMGLAPEEVLAARATFGTKQKKVIDRELALFENVKKFFCTAPACANDSYFHFSVPFS